MQQYRLTRCIFTRPNELSRVDQNFGVYSGNVIDQINENMTNCVRGRQNRSPSAAELRD
jgi:hypothetical protein